MAQQKTTASVAKDEVRSALSSALEFGDPGMGQLRNGLSGDIWPVDLSIGKTELMSKVAVAYPDDVDAFSNFVEAIEDYRAAVDGLSEADRDANKTDWMAYETLPAEGKRYVDAIAALRAAYHPVVAAFGRESEAA